MCLTLMPSTMPLLVLTAQEPVVRTATLPTWTPAVLSGAGTTALTQSPVMNPAIRFWRGRYGRGKPYRFHNVRQCWPRPVAVITNV